MSLLARRLFRPFLLAFGALALASAALAAEDARGAKDHPLLTRYPGSHIVEYEKNYNSVEFATGTANGEPKRKAVEGDATVLTYFHNDVDKQPSALQVIRNYQNAVKAIGGEVVYERLPRDGDGGETTLRVATGGKEVWVRLEPGIFSAPTQSYKLWVVEVAAMQQVVTANKLLDELNRNGFIALYIPFDTGKWDLKPEGKAAVAEIVAALKSSSALRISIEGHTDNVGTAAANKALSEKRAQSVMAAVVAGGVDAKRLAAAGFGQEKPIADNRSEEGRAKNRRVELVKK
ncbi:Peptidoglycan-associated lipoprotein [Usitatibacter rugosus]|uniref:Peptidoglycan-associated lipoprotein n=1 Tax=Usitatibacter rugosus TaxID=2732067 RepID=A0A6M4H0G4_9PROT|nr:OmpA family protein [Usitatibacter rugosus]QJR12618.1 Peptidoglycan-associated lipoprotein [Usitatibacter rugosus]